MKDELRAFVTVAEMARMVGLSRARFYQLQKAGVFPPPKMDHSKQRPFYDEELQRSCLEVRRRNCGVNGQVVLFYARRTEIAPTRPKVRKGKVAPKKESQGELVDSLKALGLTTTSAEVELAVRELFGARTSDKNEGEVIRAIFLHLKRRKDSAGNVGR